MKRRKVSAERKEAQIRVRLTGAQKTAIEMAARREALDPAAWVRTIAVKAAEARNG